MPIKALTGYCLIEPETVMPKTFLHLPDMVKDQDMPHIGKVVSISGAPVTKKGVKLALDFAVGDRVLFEKFSGLLLEVEGQRLIRIPIHKVQAVLS